MAECTHIPPKELARREDYLRAYQRNFNWLDPFTYSYRAKGAALMTSLSLLAAHFNNLYMQKPWYYALYPRLAGLAIATAAGYGMGVLRERHNRTRDMVVEHYIKNHQDDFERLNDIYGRPYSSILLPWYPRRAEYRNYD